ncbi:MAG TPA: hypothetical protein VGE45_18620 [Chloroflexia bacterium]|jgi:hypothetical protein
MRKTITNAIAPTVGKGLMPTGISTSNVTTRAMVTGIALLAILALSLAGLTASASVFANSSKPAWTASASPQVCNALDVVMLQGFYPNTSLSSKIAARPGVATIDALDTYSTTPTLA